MTLRVLLPFLVAILLTACAETHTDAQGYKWQKLNEPIPEKNWIYRFEVDATIYCANKPACVQINRKENTCTIFLPRQPPLWLVEHEEFHCEGWEH